MAYNNSIVAEFFSRGKGGQKKNKNVLVSLKYFMMFEILGNIRVI